MITLNTVRKQMSELRQAEYNPRTISDRALAGLSNSIDRFGMVQPIIWNKRTGNIVGGHQRYEVLLRKGETETDVVEVDLSENEERALNVALNNPEIQGEFNDEKLKKVLYQIKGESEDLFGRLRMDDLAASLKIALEDGSQPDNDPKPHFDKAEELRTKWGVETGDLWQLGDHRILCGDSTDSSCISRLMGDEKAKLCFTSPPYAQQRDYSDEGKVVDWDILMQGVFGNLPMANDGQVLVNLGIVHKDGEWWPYWDSWIEWMRGNGWKRFAWYVWDQMYGLRADWHGRCAPSHEFIFHFNKCAVRPQKWIRSSCYGKFGASTRNKDGSMKDEKPSKIQKYKIPDTVWRVPVEEALDPYMIPDSVWRENRQVGGIDGHPAPFSVGLMTFASRSWPGLVYEPFLGSGTAVIACENLGEKCRAMEITPKYVAVAIQRWVDLTGKTPERIPQ
jgi:DNA modification methylase